MATHLFRTGLTGRSAGVVRRYFATSSVRLLNPDVTELNQELKDTHYPRIGNRDIVGRGMNGEPHYHDQRDMPMPSIRFKANTPEVLSLRQREMGDWRELTIDEKKELYRASFRRTFAEMQAPTGEWKAIIAGVLFALSFTGWIVIGLKKYVYSPLPHTITEEWKEASLQKMIDIGANPVTGLTSKYDYDKKQWK